MGHVFGRRPHSKHPKQHPTASYTNKAVIVGGIFGRRTILDVWHRRVRGTDQEFASCVSTQWNVTAASDLNGREQETNIDSGRRKG